MVGVGKVYPPNRQVLKDIYLSFFYGAKIGVLGLNGAGKSSLLRIIAGVDKDYLGDISVQKGITLAIFLRSRSWMCENRAGRRRRRCPGTGRSRQRV